LKGTLRLDKMLSHLGYGTRSELKKLAKSGGVTVNGKVVKDSGWKIHPDEDYIEVNGEQVIFREHVYVLLNKPAGVISATEDLRDRTVVDLLDDHIRVFGVFPVGRLDKDTEGLLLLTNDGKFAHNLLSPRKHVPKTYYARVIGEVTEEDVRFFSEGVVLDDGYMTMPAQLVILDSGNPEEEKPAEIELTIHEGKFHQVKRMFEAVHKKVVYLKRISMGSLKLDPSLPPGASRELTAKELEALQDYKTVSL